jgi:hypothetical protein
LISHFFPWSFRSGLSIPELFSPQHLKLINAQVTPKRPDSSLMLTKFLIFFLQRHFFNDGLGDKDSVKRVFVNFGQFTDVRGVRNRNGQG